LEASAFEAQCQVMPGGPTLLAPTLKRAAAFPRFPTFQLTRRTGRPAAGWPGPGVESSRVADLVL
jgi:hypothetical protein